MKPTRLALAALCLGVPWATGCGPGRATDICSPNIVTPEAGVLDGHYDAGAVPPGTLPADECLAICGYTDICILVDEGGTQVSCAVFC
jgi:hypothetical protein